MVNQPMVNQPMVNQPMVKKDSRNYPPSIIC